MSVPHHHTPLLIVGSGPAGYTAAIYGARALLKPILVSGVQEGGQLTITTDVENYPGFADVIQGPWLMEQMRLQAAHVGTTLISDQIVSADLKTHPFRLRGDSGDTYSADALVIATGAQAKWLGIASEERFKGFGVSACATCDGFFFRGKEVIVVGGGNTAVEEALYLSNLAAKVTLVHRRDMFRAERILQERLFSKNNIEVIFEHVVEEIEGTTDPLSVTRATLRQTRTGLKTAVKADGVFIAIGHAPAVELFKDQLRMTPSGYIATEPGSTATSVAGVFAAGDVTDERYRQAVTAAGLGCMAALDAEKWLAAREQQRKAAE
ncbi:MAG: thioredoxin-disulfide reductase [Hyphomicrobiales bacterium]|nr:thioredoxin-disulfide reductase [Hyphomicrobiales bacterium]MBV9975114.1 thioredoxin-disulfide reductase [Hyphomicrobiales bacterium]